MTVHEATRTHTKLSETLALFIRVVSCEFVDGSFDFSFSRIYLEKGL